MVPVPYDNTVYIDHNLMCLDDNKSFIYSACPLAKQLLYKLYPATMFDLRRIENLLNALKELLKLRTGAPQGWDWEFYFGLCLQRAFFRENNLKLVYEIYKKTDHILDSDKMTLTHNLKERSSVYSFNDFNNELVTMIRLKKVGALFFFTNPSYRLVDAAVMSNNDYNIKIDFFQLTIDTKRKILSQEEFLEFPEIKQIITEVTKSFQDDQEINKKLKISVELFYVLPEFFGPDKMPAAKARIIMLNNNQDFFYNLKWKENK